MNCSIIEDLLPLYIDGCCSKESERAVEEHVKCCDRCKALLDAMKTPTDTVNDAEVSKSFRKLNEWKASVLQSVLLFFSFALITVGVALEARTSGLLNSFWAFNLVIPATGFMLSLANWYFVRVYKSRKAFSNGSLCVTFAVTLCACVWALFHYEIDLIALFTECSFSEGLEMLQAMIALNGNGILLTVAFCALSKILSNQYAKMLGKE